MIGRLLFFLFLIVPIIEIGLFIVIGQAIGLVPTLLGVVVTAVIGSMIIRRQGLSLISEIQRHMQAGALPAGQLFEGLLLGIAGALLMTPGYFTDLMGFLLLIPPIRALIYRYLRSKFTIASFTTATSSRSPLPEEDVVDLDSDKWRGR